MKRTWLLPAVFVCLLLLSLAVRAIHPSADAPFDISWSQGPSTDAAYYLAPAVDLIRGGQFKPISGQWNAPAYSLLYLPTLMIFGVGLAQVNLTTVVLSLIAFSFFFLILRQIKDEKTVWLACLFWAFTYLWAMFNRIPIIYTAMVLYMLIAVWLWIKGTVRPVYFVGAWMVLFVAVLFIKIIAAALIPAFLVGHLIIYLSRRKPVKSATTTGILVLLFTGIVVLLFALIARFFDLSPIDVAAGKIRAHMRKDLFDDNILLYIFNFGASGSVIEKNPVVSFLSYCYLIFLTRDVFQKRIRLTDGKDLTTVLFVVWLVFGAAATVFFRYAPPRFFLFLYPPMFVLAAAALSRFLEPAPRQSLGYGFYLVLPFWLIFLVFRLLLMVLVYTAENYETFVTGLRLSLPTAKNILSVLNFAGSFYFLLSVSLIISIIITALTFLADRRIERSKQQFIVRKSLRVAVVGVVVFVFLAGQATMFWTWFTKPRHTLLEASRDIGVIVGNDARIAGPYAHPLTVEDNIEHVYMTFATPNRAQPCERFSRGGVTHLAIDTVNGLTYIEAYYPDTYGCLVLIDTLYIRGNSVDIYRYTGGEGYTPTDYERAALLMKSENWRAAAEIFSRVIEDSPDSAPGYISLARCLIKLGDLRGAEAALTEALAHDPDNLMAHWGLGQIMEKNGEYVEAVAHYREASDLFPANKSIRKRLTELEKRER